MKRHWPELYFQKMRWGGDLVHLPDSAIGSYQFLMSLRAREGQSTTPTKPVVWFDHDTGNSMMTRLPQTAQFEVQSDTGVETEAIRDVHCRSQAPYGEFTPRSGPDPTRFGQIPTQSSSAVAIYQDDATHKRRKVHIADFQPRAPIFDFPSIVDASLRGRADDGSPD